MAAGSLPGLFVRLAADIADFKAGLDKANYQAAQFRRTVTRTLSGIGVTLSVAGFATFVKNTIDAADNLRDLSQQTGISIKNLVGFQHAAKQSGADLDAVVVGAGKLNQALLDAATGNDKMAAKLRLLGVDLSGVKDGTTDTATAFLQIADGSQKLGNNFVRSALLTEVLGKRAKELAPLLNEGAEGLRQLFAETAKTGELYEQTADKSDEFNDSVGRLKLQVTNLALSGTQELLPSLLKIVGALEVMQENGSGTAGTFAAIGSVLKGVVGVGILVENAISGIVDRIGALAAITGQLLSGNLAGAKAVFQDRQQRKQESQTNLIDRLEKLFVEQPVAAQAKKGGGGKNGLRNIIGDLTDNSKAIKDAHDLLKKQLESNLKTIERSIDKEGSIFQHRNQLLDLYNQENLLSINDYYAQKRAALEENLARTTALYNQEISLLQKYAAKASPTERLETQTKINELLDKQNKLQEDAKFSALQLGFDSARAMREYKDSIDQVSADLLEFKGRIADAAAIRFDISNRDLSARINAQGDTGAQAKLAAQREAVLLQANYNQLQDEASRILEQVDNLERTIESNQRIGAVSELQALRETGEARTAQLARLKEIAGELQNIAAQSNSPALQHGAANFGSKIAEFAKSADTLKLKFNEIFDSGFTDFFTDVLNGTKSVSDAFRDMGNSILQQINKLVAQDIASRLFKGISGGSGGAGGGGAYGFIDSAVGFLGGLFGGARALGGPVFPGQAYLVGENGPEMFVPPSAGRINPEVGGGVSVVNNFTVSGPVTRNSQDQIAAAAYSGTMRAHRRNN